MITEELIEKIYNNIKYRHKEDFEEALKRIFDKELELNSTYVFVWENTPEGVDFWDNVYWDLRDKHISLKDLLSPFVSVIDGPFIYLGLII